MVNKYDDLVDEILELHKTHTIKDIALYLHRTYKERNIGIEGAKKAIRRILDVHHTTTTTNQYNNKPFLSAVKSDGKIMTLKEFCDYYGLNYKDYKSAKICTHNGGATYNLATKTFIDEPIIDINEFKNRLKKSILSIKRKTPINNHILINKEVCVKLADLHFGAYVKNLINTPDYDSDILISKLKETSNIINSFGFKKVHIHILGDLIESFTGLNHINSFKSLNATQIGAEAIKGIVEILNEFLSSINNLGEIKIVAGNHDRVTSSNKEDVNGDAANIISWALSLLNYNIEFHPFIITHTVDNICNILTHGHHSISKKDTKTLCWDYGVKGKFNLITEGHLHSIIEKLSITSINNYQVIKDDSIDHRRFNCPSFFTGNNFSEQLGYLSNSGFVITYDNGKGLPNIFYFSI